MKGCFFIYKFGEGPDILQKWIYEYNRYGYSKCLYCYWLKKLEKIDKKDIYDTENKKFFCHYYPNGIPDNILDTCYPEYMNDGISLDYSNHSLCEYYKEYRFDFLQTLRKDHEKYGDNINENLPE